MRRTTAVALPILGSVLATAAAVGIPIGIAHAEDTIPGLQVNQHRVVLGTDLPHCTYEDGSGGPRPCTWNVGQPVDGNGVGLSYWIGPHYGQHFVWAHSPVRHHPANRWLTDAERADFRAHAEHNRHRPWVRCYLHNGETVHCPNGDTYTTS